jgi:hypothetical protein
MIWVIYGLAILGGISLYLVIGIALAFKFIPAQIGGAAPMFVLTWPYCMFYIVLNAVRKKL